MLWGEGIIFRVIAGAVLLRPHFAQFRGTGPGQVALCVTGLLGFGD